MATKLIGHAALSKSRAEEIRGKLARVRAANMLTERAAYDVTTICGWTEENVNALLSRILDTVADTDGAVAYEALRRVVYECIDFMSNQFDEKGQLIPCAHVN